MIIIILLCFKYYKKIFMRSEVRIYPNKNPNKTLSIDIIDKFMPVI